MNGKVLIFEFNTLLGALEVDRAMAPLDVAVTPVPASITTNRWKRSSTSGVKSTTRMPSPMTTPALLWAVG